MTDFALQFDVPASRGAMGPSAATRALGAIRYAGVLAVFGLFFLVRPREALTIFRERRWDSPLRRRG
jgi:hypothetical protein